MSFSVDARIEHGGVVVVIVHGTVEHTTIAPLCDTINHVVEQHRPPSVHIDLQFVTYVDAAAVGALDACRRTARNRGTTIVLRNASAAVHRTLQRSGMFDHHGT
ncbi:STAS domain-containing protein [Dactylosporangium aurantiacum]|uniref:STAS domain-containing protein n=1 Tax=Dactylosporangium aurantiacum TaxID=35754 RepID=A0A9Q9IAY7_9ACTN|nr:STAS domain-containing protein [Dactylosporangium aurantiacum]MDG6108701.1 STAS domain-containing protein [Dactylosporangium aurantiacum]UWZ51065.1 STAS domain-containing protein [Dactylosporangium aurantiacum]